MVSILKTAPPPSPQRHPHSHPSSNAISPTRQLFRTIVTLTAGPAARPFQVHRELLCASSPFFAAALNPTYAFLESRTQTLHLPDAGAEDVEYLIQYLYTRTLDHEGLEGPHPAFFRLIRLYGLADRLLLGECKNDIVDEVLRLAEERNAVLSPDDTRSVWAGGREGWKGMRRVGVDLFVWKKTDVLVESHGSSWDERFLRELVGMLKREEGRKPAPWKTREGVCRRYHEHVGGGLCTGSERGRK